MWECETRAIKSHLRDADNRQTDRDHDLCLMKILSHCMQSFMNEEFCVVVSGAITLHSYNAYIYTP